MEFKLYTADVVGVASNCLYPHEVTVTTAEEVAKAVKTDYAAARYKDSYRNIQNFEESELLMFDCDNDGTEDPGEWITPGFMADEFASVPFVLIPSRNNMKPKNGKAPRPKFHVGFIIDKCTNAEQYAGIKASVRMKYPFFDRNALDAARFFFGAETVRVSENSCMWFTLYRKAGNLKYEPSAACKVFSAGGGNPFIHCIKTGFVSDAI